MSRLVLSRKRGERIIVNTDIVIEIVEVRGQTVKILVEAPREVPVDREEVLIARGRKLAPSVGRRSKNGAA